MAAARLRDDAGQGLASARGLHRRFGVEALPRADLLAMLGVSGGSSVGGALLLLAAGSGAIAAVAWLAAGRVPAAALRGSGGRMVASAAAAAAATPTLVSCQQRRVFTDIPVSLSINRPTARYFSCRKETDNIIIRMSVYSILCLVWSMLT
jgi:hypothetical protein